MGPLCGSAVLGYCRIGRFGMDIDKYDFSRGHGHDLVHPIILAAVFRSLKTYLDPNMERSICDLGCGYGKVANAFQREGWDVLGLDPSSSGVTRGQEEFPDLRLEKISGDEDLAQKYGQFSVVLSIEVVEHVFSPKMFMKQASDLVKPGGLLIFSTPYHGYWKNLALALAGKIDSHVDPLWEGGHIKFWSIPTLRQLGDRADLVFENVERVGRIPVLAKSMVMTWRKEES